MIGVLRLSRCRSGVLAALLGSAAFVLFPGAATADDVTSYLQSAHQLERTHDLRGAEIQLRNAAQAAPNNSAIRVELAKVYLQLRNPNAAEAELFAAHTRGAQDEVTAPLMAQAMLQMGEFADLLKNVPAGNRPPKEESVVRAYRGIAEMSLNELDRARTMFADAERLDPKSVMPLVGETRLLIAQNQLDAASLKADQALKLDPKNGDVLDAKGMILAMRGQADAAMQQFTTALAIDPANLRALLDRADLQIARNRLDGAEKDLAQIRKVAPASAMAIYLQAVIDAQRGKYKEADELLDKLRGSTGGFPQAYLITAEVKFKLNQLDQAQAFAQKVIAQTGDQPKAYQLLGAIALRRGDLDGGIAQLEKAVKLAPNDAEMLAALGQAYVAHGDLDKARQAFDQAAVKAPGNAPLATERALTNFVTGDREASVTALGDIFKGGKGSVLAGPPLVIEALQIGQLDVAEATARQLVAKDPANTSYQELLAAVRIQQRDYPGAETLLRGLLSKNPNLPSARRDLAQVYIATNRKPQAKALYQDRLRSNPKDLDSLEALADIAFRDGDDNGAIALLTQAQAASPANPQPSLRIIAILSSRKKWPEAIGRARVLLTKFGKEPSVEDALDHLYFESGDRAASRAAYSKAIVRFPSDAAIFAHYAGVLAAGHDYAAAAPLVLRASKLDPRNSDLKHDFVSLTYLAKGPDAALSASQSVTGDRTGTAAVLMTADVLYQNNNRAAAVALLEKRRAQAPSTAVVIKLAGLYQRDNHIDQALALLEPWAAAHPDDADARFALAQLESAAGKFDRALAEYEWLVVQKPDNPLILNNLAWLYDWKRDPRALATAKKAMNLAPASGSVADTLGWILEKQGDNANAMKYITQASASAPSDGTIQYHFAVVLSKTGNANAARNVLQKTLKLNLQPDTKSAAEALLAKLGTNK
jgi:putative PEP-CTERM system TPR-repeat lipoprotein